jgi:hypothetical protein
VFVAGARGTFDSVDCAMRAAAGEISPVRHRAPDGRTARIDAVR